MIPKRKCPRCSKTLTYSSKSNYNGAVKRDDVCKSCGLLLSDKKKQSDLSILLEENPLTYYWIGFLLADGNFGKTNTIKCTLSSIDKNHLIKLKKFLKIKALNFEQDKKYSTIKAMDGINVPLICKKFNINSNKTYFPPKTSFIKKIKNKDLITALMIGFIDGDGCIRPKNKSFSLSVKCHSSWLDILSFFAKEINKTSNAKINNAGYAYFTITNHSSLKELKKKVLVMKLPVLKRKWDVIDLDFVPHKEALERNFKTFEKLYKKFKDIPYFEKRLNSIINGKK